METAGVDYGNLSGVTGSILKEGKITSTFQADRAQLDRSKQTLNMSGTVKITGEVQGLVMVAKQVDYDQTNGRITALGDVTVTSKTMKFGPFPKLIATSDLKKVATPGKFK